VTRRLTLTRLPQRTRKLRFLPLSSIAVCAWTSMDEILELQVRATGDFVTRRSIALVLKSSKGKPGIGSSTCVQVGSHYLLATAGHVIEDLEDDEIDLRAASELSKQRIPFVARSCDPRHPRPATDVAWIELDPQVVADHRLQFIGLRRSMWFPVKPGNIRSLSRDIRGRLCSATVRPADSSTLSQHSP
jgi:hypothetical protein